MKHFEKSFGFGDRVRTLSKVTFQPKVQMSKKCPVNMSCYEAFLKTSALNIYILIKQHIEAYEFYVYTEFESFWFRSRYWSQGWNHIKKWFSSQNPHFDHMSFLHELWRNFSPKVWLWLIYFMRYNDRGHVIGSLQGWFVLIHLGLIYENFQNLEYTKIWAFLILLKTLCKESTEAP